MQNTTTPSLTTVDILFRIRERQQQIDALKKQNDNDKITLEALYTEGSISDKISTANISATRSTRTTWEYNDETKAAIKQLQEMAVVDGIATPKHTVSWVVRESKA